MHRYRSFSRLLRAAIVMGFGLLVLAGGRAAAADNLAAFRSFLANGAYANANYYLKNKLVDAKALDTSQLFYDIFVAKYAGDVTKNAPGIDKLYSYLNAIAPIDLNKTMSCSVDDQTGICLLVDMLFTGAPRPSIQYFVDRGLDLNKTIPELVPATLPMALRLGVTYSIADLNYFVSKGMVLGDELYPIQTLASYRDQFLSNYQLNMPAEYLSMGDLNMLDMLVIALGSRMSMGYPVESTREKSLCDFIAYAAPSFKPSFDYLLYLLRANENFRGKNIGKMERYSGNVIYPPFPPSCVSLVQKMALNHSQLDAVISQFSDDRDMEIANWLISIKSAAK